VNADLDAGMEFTEFAERGEKRVDGAFIDAEREFAAIEAGEFGETFFHFIAEVDEPLGVIAEKRAGVG